MLPRTPRLALVLTAAFALGCQSSVEPRRPVQIIVEAGEAQGANVGTALPIAPVVRVLNTEGAPVVGTQVNFRVTTGGGTVTGANVTTDGEGLAAVGSWTLGSVGENHLTASASGQEVTISAVGRCAVGGTIVLDELPTNGNLQNTDCRYQNGEFTDRYTLVLTTQRAVRFSQSSVAYDAFLELQGATNVIGFNNDATSTTDNASLRAILAPGTYDVNPSTFEPARTGAYTVSAAAAPENESGCDILFAMPGIETVQSLNATAGSTEDCASGSLRYDAIGIYLIAGRNYVFTANSLAFDTTLELLEYGSERTVAQNDNANSTTTNARISYTPLVSTFYLLLAGNRIATGAGAYTLRIQ